MDQKVSLWRPLRLRCGRLRDFSDGFGRLILGSSGTKSPKKTHHPLGFIADSSPSVSIKNNGVEDACQRMEVGQTEENRRNKFGQEVEQTIARK